MKLDRMIKDGHFDIYNLIESSDAYMYRKIVPCACCGGFIFYKEWFG
jgi:hypothetical protein